MIMNVYRLSPLFVLMLFCTLSCSNVAKHNRFKVKQGDFQASLTESGELQAINSKVITMPFLGWKYGWRFQVVSLEEHGAKVSKGDTVVIIDPSPVIKVLDEEQNKLEIEKANYNKLLASQKSQLSQLKSELESEQANYELIKLQVDKFSFEPENKREEKNLELDIANVKLDKIKTQLHLKEVVFRNDIKIQQIKINQINKSIREAEEAAKKLKLPSPYDGVFQVERNRRTGKMMLIGDEVHQGANIASIPDMSKMKVLSIINETDISKIKLNQEVIVRLDAYPDKPFEGKISYIGKFSHEKDNNNPIKVFDIEVVVLDSDEALKPGMTVSCEIITHSLENVFYVENECIYHDSSDYFVMDKGAGNQDRIPVKILARNNFFSAIQGEVEKGQRLISKDETEAEKE